MFSAKIKFQNFNFLFSSEFQAKSFKLLFTIVITLLSKTLYSSAQDSSKIFLYPPLDIPLKLSGNYGDIRSGTFHFGIDFRTNEEIGYPVYAVAKGFVSRIKIEPGGYGRAIYIDHPNGMTSVYAHLSALNDTLSKFIKQEQYKRKSFNIDMNLKPDQFIVNQCSIVGFSGNAGMSSGPHLHFELRDTKNQNTLNCLSNDVQVWDTIKPVINSIWIYPQISYFTEQGIPKIQHHILHKNGNYKTYQDSIFLVPDLFGIGIEMFDNVTDTTRRLSIYSSQLYFDSKLLYEEKYDELSFDEVNDAYGAIDYEMKNDSNINIFNLFTQPNQELAIYKCAINHGLIYLADNEVHKIKIKVRDANNNTSELQFGIKVSMSMCNLNNKDYSTNSQLIGWKKQSIIEKTYAKIIFPEKSLYSDAFISIDTISRKKRYLSAPFRIGSQKISVKKAYSITIPVINIPVQQRKKLVILNISNEKSPFSIGGSYSKNELKASTKYFGCFALGIDTIPPRIIPLNISNGKNMINENDIKIKITDNLSGISEYNAIIDGMWALFEYDAKNNLISHTFDCNRFVYNKNKHKLIVSVIDKCGNSKIYSCYFIK